MRELKFRAWDNDNNEWLNKKDVECLIIYLDGNYEIYRGWCIVKPDLTIEQYTGLKDKDGKEIYEGDIVRWCGGFYEIYFDIVQGWRGIDRRGSIPNGHTLYQMTINNVDKPNIVGNIHENKELLNGYRED